jgi:predicted ATPase/transcriptional regulator with XRE-family HTH domain
MDDEHPSGSSGFGRLLREYRLSVGLSQEALAERARMSSHGVSALERGYRRSPHRDTLALLAKALDLDDEQRSALELAAVRPQVVRRGGKAAEHNGHPQPATEAPSSGLPLAWTNFVGRETELREIGALVREHRLVTITGSGGVGKTQTALQVGSAVEAGGAVAFVALAPVEDSAFVVAAVASALGVGPAPNQTPLEALLVNLKNRSLLLILDNCEHVIAEAAGIAGAILGNCAGVRILATSREPLRVSGEHLYRLPSLSLSSSVVLFGERAFAAGHGFALNDDNTPVVSEICNHLDGIPLAIELAAARTRLLSVQAIRERLSDRFRILTGGERTALPRQHTMHAAIDWSYELLAEPERCLFERLSVFAGGCTLGQAATLYAGEPVGEDDILNALSSLVDKSLIVADFDAEEPRYWLLESFKQYAREKLAARGEEQLIIRRFALSWLEEAERRRAAFRAGISGLWVSAGDVYNWRAVLQWALADRRDVLLGQRLAAMLPAGSMPLEARQWVTAALDQVDDATPPSLTGRLWFAQAMCAFALREFGSTVTASERAIAAYREAGDLTEVALANNIAGHALATLGRVAEAKGLIEEAMAIARSLGNDRLTAWTLRCLAHAYARDGDVASARNYLAEALPAYRSSFTRDDLAFAINDLGTYEFCAGKAEIALVHAREMLSIARARDSKRVIVTALDAASTYLTKLGRYVEAEDLAREALQLASRDRLEVFVAYALQSIAVIDVLKADSLSGSEFVVYERSTRLLGCVDALLIAMGSSRLMIHEQLHDRAVRALQEALGHERLAELTEAGAQISRDMAVAEALAT